MAEIKVKEFTSQFTHQTEERLFIGSQITLESDRTVHYKGMTIPNFEHVWLTKNTNSVNPYIVIILDSSEVKPHILIAELPKLTQTDIRKVNNYLDKYHYRPKKIVDEDLLQ